VTGFDAPLPELPERDPRLPRFAWLLVFGGMAMVVLALAASRQGPAPLVPHGPEPLPVVSVGETLYGAAGCASCHDPSGRDSALAPGLAGVAGRAMQRLEDPGYGGEAQSATGYLEEAILDHCADALPGYDCATAPDVSVRLSMADVANLVQYLLTLAEVDAP
jgi:hypothetical protein